MPQVFVCFPDDLPHVFGESEHINYLRGIAMTKTLVRPDLSADFHTLQNDVNQVFSSMFNGLTPSRRRWIPAMDLVEDNTSLVLTMDVPGLERQDIDVSVQDDVLTICGERTETIHQEDAGVQRLERSYGLFERSVQLGTGIDPELVEASCINGVLQIRIPKPQQTQSTKVKVGTKPLVSS